MTDEINQCDGCRRGLPVSERGIHRGPGSWDLIGCTAARYPSGPWKLGDEFLPFHPSASHINPDYRDGWNACFAAAAALTPKEAP